jgi:hypothetical protein
MACGEKRISHTETDAKKQLKPKKQMLTQTILWHPAKHHTHTKRELPSTIERRREVTAGQHNYCYVDLSV